jgi:hypothetical protein
MQPSPPTLTLTAYPKFIWEPSCARHPPGAPDYCWKSHFRTMCAIARDFAADSARAGGAYWIAAGDTERWFIGVMAKMTAEEIEILILEIATCPRGWSSPLAFLDPTNPDLPRTAAAPVPSRRRAV